MAITKNEIKTGIKLGLGLGAILYALYVPAAVITLYGIYGYVSLDAYLALPIEHSNKMIALYSVSLFITAIITTFLIWNDRQSGTTPSTKSLAQMRAEMQEILDAPKPIYTSSIFANENEREAA
jgi:hypothetical protein